MRENRQKPISHADRKELFILPTKPQRLLLYAKLKWVLRSLREPKKGLYSFRKNFNELFVLSAKPQLVLRSLRINLPLKFSSPRQYSQHEVFYFFTQK